MADRLSRHFAEGRLDEAEFKLRLDRAMGAVTRGDLAGLFGDLPRLAEDPEPRPPRRRRHLILPVVLLVSVLALAVGSTASLMRVPWVLVVLAGLFLWYRARRRHGTPRAPGTTRPLASPGRPTPGRPSSPAARALPAQPPQRSGHPPETRTSDHGRDGPGPGPPGPTEPGKEAPAWHPPK